MMRSSIHSRLARLADILLVVLVGTPSTAWAGAHPRGGPAMRRGVTNRKGGAYLVILVMATLGLTACGSTGADPATSPASTSTPAGSASQGLHLAAIGDSIPNNSPQDCPGCTGFVDRYAKAVETATGRPVEVNNLSQHNNLLCTKEAADRATRESIGVDFHGLVNVS
jgi:hypothetical protein